MSDDTSDFTALMTLGALGRSGVGFDEHLDDIDMKSGHPPYRSEMERTTHGNPRSILV